MPTIAAVEYTAHFMPKTETSPNDSREQACLECGTPTSNPRFCSRSCAAKYNNRHAPKRKPEGSCATCGERIPTKQTYCKKCRETRANEKARVDANVQIWRSPDGQVVEQAVRRVWVHQAMTFEVAYSQFPVTDTCRTFLEFLLGVIFSKPAYIRPHDIHRYASLVHNFSMFKSDRIATYYEPDACAVTQLSLNRLDIALGEWIRSYLNEQSHPLMPTYALDTAWFIHRHAFGSLESGRGTKEGWQIRPMTQSDGSDFRYIIDDPKLKKEITQHLYQTVARFRVPEGCRFIDRHKQEVLWGGVEFLAGIPRCHLSSALHEEWNLIAEDRNAPPHDIADELCFHSDILMRNDRPRVDRMNLGLDLTGDVTNDLQNVADYGLEADIPVWWITEVMQRPGWGGEWETFPMLSWSLPEAD